MKRLVGIPWGHKAPPKEADCVSLMLYAQRILWGRDINLTHIDMMEHLRFCVTKVQTHKLGCCHQHLFLLT